MRLPGRAWLQFEVSPGKGDGAPQSRITQTVYFEPKGLGGTLYWTLVRWAHRGLFAGQLRALADWIEERADERTTPAAPETVRRSPTA
jgi:hypothetical protein